MHDCEECHMKPGSETAQAKGCTCPVMDNGRGHRSAHFGLWVTAGCPVHDVTIEEDES